MVCFFFFRTPPCCFPWCCVEIFTDMSQHYMSRTCQSAPSKTTSSPCCSVALFQHIASVSARNARTYLRLIRCGRGRRQIRKLVGAMRLLWRSSYDRPTLPKEEIEQGNKREEEDMQWKTALHPKSSCRKDKSFTSRYLICMQNAPLTPPPPNYCAQRAR